MVRDAKIVAGHRIRAHVNDEGAEPIQLRANRVVLRIVNRHAQAVGEGDEIVELRHAVLRVPEALHLDEQHLRSGTRHDRPPPGDAARSAAVAAEFIFARQDFVIREGLCNVANGGLLLEDAAHVDQVLLDTCDSVALHARRESDGVSSHTPESNGKITCARKLLRRRRNAARGSSSSSAW